VSEIRYREAIREMYVVNKYTGKKIEVKDIPPHLLSTALVALDQRLERWAIPAFLDPYEKTDQQKPELMNERSKAWLFMNKIYDESDCVISYYLDELAIAYHLPKYDPTFKKDIITAVFEDKEMDEYNRL
jgi:hypothetical protein